MFILLVLQEKNEYAVNVWRRVRMKLEGRDSDHTDGRKLSVQEQVNIVYYRILCNLGTFEQLSKC